MGRLVESFQELECWKKAREVVNLAYEHCEKGQLSRDFVTQKQFKSASLSIMNNIAEGFGRFSKREFARFLNIAIGSGYEVKSMLYVFEDRNYLKPEELKELHQKLDSCMRLSKAMLKAIRSKLDYPKK